MGDVKVARHTPHLVWFSGYGGCGRRKRHRSRWEDPKVSDEEDTRGVSAKEIHVLVFRPVLSDQGRDRGSAMRLMEEGKRARDLEVNGYWLTKRKMARVSEALALVNSRTVTGLVQG